MTEEEKKKLQNEEAAKAGTQKYGETADLQSNSDYDNTMAALDEMQQTPQLATTQYDQQISDIYDKIVNRKPFEYDINSDPVYQQLKQEYTQNGRMAMEDTMGQAAALTGGYGNTYAQNVGQQQYNAYMRGLNEQIPDLYNAALDRYTAEGNELYANLDLLRGLRGDERSWQLQQDELARAAEERDYNRSIYADERDYERGVYDDERDYERQRQSREDLLTFIALGYKPTDEEIAAAGLTPEQVQIIMDQYAGTGSSSGGGGYDGDVLALQQYLNSLGASLVEDGIMGPKTIQAAKDFGIDLGGLSEDNGDGGGGADAVKYLGIRDTVHAYVTHKDTKSAIAVLLNNSDVLSDDQVEDICQQDEKLMEAAIEVGLIEKED